MVSNTWLIFFDNIYDGHMLICATFIEARLSRADTDSASSLFLVRVSQLFGYHEVM